MKRRRPSCDGGRNSFWIDMNAREDSMSLVSALEYLTNSVGLHKEASELGVNITNQRLTDAAR